MCFFDYKYNCSYFISQKVPPTTDYTPLATVDEVRSKQLPSIHRLLVKNLEKITKSLTQYNEQVHLAKLQNRKKKGGVGGWGKVKSEIRGYLFNTGYDTSICRYSRATRGPRRRRNTVS